VREDLADTWDMIVDIFAFDIVWDSTAVSILDSERSMVWAVTANRSGHREPDCLSVRFLRIHT
jgi:hypothetical protein